MTTKTKTPRGIHTKPNRGLTTTYLTPPELLECLGEFDLDPCCPDGPMPWETAKIMIRESEDGLSLPWQGRVWVNPPYGQNEVWLARLAEHGDGVTLVAARTEVEKWFWPYVWEAADAVLFLRGRLHFYRQDGRRAQGNAGHGSVLVAYGEWNVDALRESGLPGRLVVLEGTEQVGGRRR